MAKLNEDVLYLILKELRNRNSLYSCLLVNKTWCEIIVPILWKNPWIHLIEQLNKSLFNVIISHLSNKTKEILRVQGFNISGVRQQRKPLFNYISFCRYLNLDYLEKILFVNDIDPFKNSIVINEILTLFINRNTKFTHLYMPVKSRYQIHLIPGAEYCFSKLKFLQCCAGTNRNVLEGLAKISKSIEKLDLCVDPGDNNTGIIQLIEAQRNLNDVCFTNCVTESSFHKTLEESLIKRADTIQHLRIRWPTTKFLQYFVNLISLNILLDDIDCSHLESVSLPFLRILKAYYVPSKSLACLIKNTKGQLTEIIIDYGCGYNNEGHIQAIYQNCPNLKYLKLFLKNSDISELEELLINCQCLDGLVIQAKLVETGWNSIFKILIKSSPASLFKFKFYSSYGEDPKWNSIKLFLDNWKCRHPMLLQTSQDMSDEIEKYIAEGTVKKYDQSLCDYEFEIFEWIRKSDE